MCWLPHVVKLQLVLLQCSYRYGRQSDLKSLESPIICHLNLGVIVPSSKQMCLGDFLLLSLLSFGGQLLRVAHLLHVIVVCDSGLFSSARNAAIFSDGGGVYTGCTVDLATASAAFRDQAIVVGNFFADAAVEGVLF